jgi:DNA-binding transcriptional LysR family regulator
METKYLRYFLQVCEDKSLSSASKKLFLSQQALSSIIRKLEDRFGVALFERAPSGMHVTEFGECLYGQAKRIISLVDETYGKIETLKTDRRDALDLGMSFGVMSALPQYYFVNFQKKYPDVELHFTEYPDTLCEKVVLDDREQIGFDISPVDGSLFDMRSIVRDRFCILAHKNGRFYDMPSVPFSALAGEKFLLLDRKFKLRNLFEAKCRESGFEPRCALETMELVLIHNFSSLDRGGRDRGRIHSAGYSKHTADTLRARLAMGSVSHHPEGTPAFGGRPMFSAIRRKRRLLLSRVALTAE